MTITTQYVSVEIAARVMTWFKHTHPGRKIVDDTIILTFDDPEHAKDLLCSVVNAMSRDISERIIVKVTVEP